ncbi:protein translocase subunit SecD [Actinomyces lilanjuaniae]|uniref:Protein translocase subunit SecD n=1 Tax=Actinomyces lilanjuaniae TaxID=2321394 RepID=A0ABM6Z321_9ACTO|nr:protein translocase subunit SecD [Actinomyces lilanjuaniae]AYD89743.1 protein translocase subunit SecD [Actinomyces lilanjuaniae]
MSRKQRRRPGRRLLMVVLVIAVGFAVLAVGTMRGWTSMTPGLALDLEGGTQIILTPTTTDGSQVTDSDVDQAIDVIRQRVDASGVSEAQISRQGGQNIVVSLPGEPDEQALELVRTSAVMYFRPVIRAIQYNAHLMAQAQNQQATASDGATAGAETDATAGDEEAATTVTPEEIATSYADVDGDGTISSDPLPETSQDASSDSWISEQLLYEAYMTDCTQADNLTGETQDPSVAVVSCSRDGSPGAYVLGPAEIAGTELSNAVSGLETTSQGSTTSNWVVSLEFNSEGTQAFADLSGRLVGYRDTASASAGASPSTDAEKAQFAIVLDGLTIMASGFNEEVTSAITDGRVQITGDFTQDEAATLANQLSFGSLPLSFTVQSEQQVSATLGTEQLRNGLIAGLIGFVLIIIYLAWQYRGLMVVAVSSLLVAAAVTYLVIALLSWGMGYRLSLAGVAGLIIAIGVTVDSFIIYFERVRDEARQGRTLSTAVDEGWKHARRTIVISDTVNILAAVVLYFLAVGGVQGFAFTLGVTTVVDLAVIILFTHPLMEWLLRFRFFNEGHRLSGLDPERLGGSAVSTYGRGREALAQGVTMSLARRKAEARSTAHRAVADNAGADTDDEADGEAHDALAGTKDGEAK